MDMKTMIFASMLALGLSITINGAPAEQTRAYCKIVWLFAVPCPQVNTAIVTQIKAMGSYKLGTVTPVQIQANHTSGVGQVENINFTTIPMTMGMGCHVDGSSMSAFWFSLLDNGTNYCNLHNIIDESGLSKVPGFVEFTNEWLCLGIGLSACK